MKSSSHCWNEGKSGNGKLENYQNCRDTNKNNESEVVKRKSPVTLTKPALTTKKEKEKERWEEGKREGRRGGE